MKDNTVEVKVIVKIIRTKAKLAETERPQLTSEQMDIGTHM